MKQPVLTIGLVVLAIAIIGGVYINMPSANSMEKACTDSGGTVETLKCCNSTSDFPNLCLIGACGCAPDQSHDIKVCECEEDKCFDGSKCVSRA